MQTKMDEAAEAAKREGEEALHEVQPSARYPNPLTLIPRTPIFFFFITLKPRVE